MAQIAKLESSFAFRVLFIRWSALAVFVVCAISAFFLGGGMVVLGMICGAGLLIYSFVLKAGCIVHDRVEFLRQTLNTLSHDAGKKGRFDVTFRLRPSKEKVSEGPNPRDPAGKETLFRDEWLTLTGRLSDETSISESCIDLIRLRTKHNSGKVKTKERKACLLRIQLSYKPETYGDASIAARALAKPFRLPVGAQLKAFTYDDKALGMKTILKTNINAASMHETNAAMLLGAYRVLNLARKKIAR
jgi:hypothetical protein